MQIPEEPIPLTCGNSGPTHSNAGFLPRSSVTWTFSISLRLRSTLAISYSRRTLAAQENDHAKKWLETLISPLEWWETGCMFEKQAARSDSWLTLELVLVLLSTVVLSNQNLSSHVQTDHTRIRHQEEHDKLLTHDPQWFVLPTVNRSW